jgi:dipeptidyl aminopeptidase/acylaminoacyl peptidase
VTNPGADATLTLDQLLAIRSRVVVEPPQWSADGTQIAFMSDLSGTTDLWAIGAQGGFPRRLTTGMGSVRFLDLRNPRWSPDGRWIVYISEKTGSSELWLWPNDGGPSFQLTRLGANINALNWSPDSQSIVFSCNRQGSFDIYRAEIDGSKTTRLTHDALYEGYPVFTPDGRQIVYVRLNEAWTEHDVIAIPALGGDGRVILHDGEFFDYHYGRTFGYPLVSPDGRTVLFRSYRSGYINYWQAPLEGGPAYALYAQEYDQSDASYSPDGQHAAYCANHNGTIELCVIDTRRGTPRRLVAPCMGVCAAPQWSPDGQHIAYLHQSPSAPLDLWTVSVADGITHQLTNSMLGGGIAQRLVTPEKVKYSSFDGQAINAYLYRPRSPGAGVRFPAILWIHGGPASQWLDSFQPQVQYFVQQGYVVLMPNVRGSTGYGQTFEKANYQDYGGGDLKDVVAGVDYLNTLDYIDPHKLAITGSSYGGYMSMAAICFAPGVFQASIAQGGYSSQSDRMGMDGGDEQVLRHKKQLTYRLGPFETSADVYRRVSPLYAVKNATTPVFVLHGEGGQPSTPSSRNFVQALEKEYKTVQYKTYPNEGYYVQSTANTRQMLLDMKAFLETYL